MIHQLSDPGTRTAGLEDYLQAIKARKLLVLLPALIGLLLGWVLDGRRVETYSATATVLIGPSPVGATGNGLQAPKLDLEKEVMTSDAVAAAALADIETDLTQAEILEQLDVSFVPNSDVLRVEATLENADLVAAVVNSMATTYVDQREQGSIDFFSNEIDVTQTQLTIAEEATDEATSGLAELQAQRNNISTTLSATERAALLVELSEQIAVATTETTQSVVTRRDLSSKLGTAKADLETRQTAGSVLRTAVPPANANGLPSSVFWLAGLLIGGLLGLIAAFIAERLDQTARSESDLALALDTSVLGSVPSFSWYDRSGAAALVMQSDSKKPAASQAREAYRRLRSAIGFLETTNDATTFLFTSAYPAEGKSLTVANIGVALAHAGRRVAIVSADMRRPSIETVLGVANDGGLSLFLGGDDSQAKLFEVPDLPNLVILPAGPSPSNPSELLETDRFELLINELRNEVEVVLIDCPPVFAAADALAASRDVDGVIIVVDSRRTSSTELLRVRSEIDRAGGKIVGAILNRQRATGRFNPFSRRKGYAYYGQA